MNKKFEASWVATTVEANYLSFPKYLKDMIDFDQNWFTVINFWMMCDYDKSRFSDFSKGEYFFAYLPENARDECKKYLPFDEENELSFIKSVYLRCEDKGFEFLKTYLLFKKAILDLVLDFAILTGNYDVVDFCSAFKLSEIQQKKIDFYDKILERDLDLIS